MISRGPGGRRRAWRRRPRRQGRWSRHFPTSAGRAGTLGRCESRGGAPRLGQKLPREDTRQVPELVSAVRKPVLISLAVVLLIVLAARDPQGLGHVVGLIFTLAA